MSVSELLPFPINVDIRLKHWKQDLADVNQQKSAILGDLSYLDTVVQPALELSKENRARKKMMEEKHREVEGELWENLAIIEGDLVGKRSDVAKLQKEIALLGPQQTAELQNLQAELERKEVEIKVEEGERLDFEKRIVLIREENVRLLSIKEEVEAKLGTQEQELTALQETLLKAEVYIEKRRAAGLELAWTSKAIEEYSKDISDKILNSEAELRKLETLEIVPVRESGALASYIETARNDVEVKMEQLGVDISQGKKELLRLRNQKTATREQMNRAMNLLKKMGIAEGGEQKHLVDMSSEITNKQSEYQKLQQQLGRIRSNIDKNRQDLTTRNKLLEFLSTVRNCNAFEQLTANPSPQWLPPHFKANVPRVSDPSVGESLLNEFRQEFLLRLKIGALNPQTHYLQTYWTWFLEHGNQLSELLCYSSTWQGEAAVIHATLFSEYAEMLQKLNSDNWKHKNVSTEKLLQLSQWNFDISRDLARISREEVKSEMLQLQCVLDPGLFSPPQVNGREEQEVKEILQEMATESLLRARIASERQKTATSEVDRLQRERNFNSFVSFYNGDSTQDVVDYFKSIGFKGTTTASNKALLIDLLTAHFGLPSTEEEEL